MNKLKNCISFKEEVHNGWDILTTATLNLSISNLQQTLVEIPEQFIKEELLRQLSHTIYGDIRNQLHHLSGLMSHLHLISAKTYQDQESINLLSKEYDEIVNKIYDLTDLGESNE